MWVQLQKHFLIEVGTSTQRLVSTKQSLFCLVDLQMASQSTAVFADTVEGLCTELEKVTLHDRDCFLVEIKTTCTVDHFNREGGSVKSSSELMGHPGIFGVTSIRAIDCPTVPVLTIKGRDLDNVQCDQVGNFFIIYRPPWAHEHDNPTLRELYESRGFRNIKPFVEFSRIDRVEIRNIPSDTLIEVTGYNIKIIRPDLERGFQWVFL